MRKLVCLCCLSASALPLSVASRRAAFPGSLSTRSGHRVASGWQLACTAFLFAASPDRESAAVGAVPGGSYDLGRCPALRPRRTDGPVQRHDDHAWTLVSVHGAGGLAAGPPREGRTMIGLLGRGSIAREQEKARPGRARRATAVLGMLAVPLAAAGLTALPAAAAPAYAVTATINVGSYPVGVGVDPSAHTVYVSSSSDTNTVSAINEATFSLQGNVKTLEGARHADRDAQFRYINAQARDHIDAGDR